MRYLKLFLLLIVFIVSGSLFTSRALAAPADLSDVSLNYSINTNTTFNLDASFSITNPTGEGIVSSVEVAFPYNNCNNVAATMPGREVTVSIDRKGGCTIEVLFGSNPIKPNEKAEVALSASFGDSVKRGDASFITLDNPFRREGTQINIEIDPSMSEPTFLSTIPSKKEARNITFNTSKSIVIGFGEVNSVGLASEYEIQNNDPKDKIVLQPLPSENQRLDVLYESIENAERIYIEEIQNYFAAVPIDGESSKVFAFRGEAFIQSEESFNFSPMKLSIPGVLPEEYRSNENSLEGIHSLYKKLISESEVKREARGISDPWKKEVKGSLDITLQMAQILDNYGYPYQVRYGYILSDNSSNIVPHVWLLAEIEGDVYTLDPFLGALRNVSYFSESVEIDRIAFGTIGSLASNINSYLGLKQYEDINQLPSIKFSEINVEEVSNPLFTAKIPRDTVLYSGFFSTIPIEITSTSKSIERFDSILIDGANARYKPLSNATGDFEVALVPNQTSVVPVEFRTNNFFLKGSSEIAITLKLQKDDVIFTSDEIVTFQVDTRTIWFLIVVFNIILVGVSFIMYRIVRKNG